MVLAFLPSPVDFFDFRCDSLEEKTTKLYISKQMFSFNIANSWVSVGEDSPHIFVQKRIF